MLAFFAFPLRVLFSVDVFPLFETRAYDCRDSLRWDSSSNLIGAARVAEFPTALTKTVCCDFLCSHCPSLFRFIRCMPFSDAASMTPLETIIDYMKDNVVMSWSLQILSSPIVYMVLSIVLVMIVAFRQNMLDAVTVCCCYDFVFSPLFLLLSLAILRFEKITIRVVLLFVWSGTHCAAQRNPRNGGGKPEAYRCTKGSSLGSAETRQRTRLIHCTQFVQPDSLFHYSGVIFLCILHICFPRTV